MAETERPRVKAASKMDDETFLKHMNARHKGVAGIAHFGKSNVPDDANERLLRKMHDFLHESEKYPTNHDHGEE